MHKSESIVADSSFYLCFLDDIKQPRVLVQILDNFFFYLPPTVFDEIRVCKTFFHIKDHKNTQQVKGYNYGAILQPFLGRKQLDGGESEAIALAYIFQEVKKCDRLILDDGDARSFVQANIPTLQKLMTGTVGFIGDCHCTTALLGKQQAIDVLIAISKSKFRIKGKDLSNIKKRIEGC